MSHSLRKFYRVFVVVLLVMGMFSTETVAEHQQGDITKHLIPMWIDTIEIIDHGHWIEFMTVAKPAWYDGYYGYQSLHNLDGSIKYDVSVDALSDALIAITHNPTYERKTKLLVENLDTGDKYYYNVYSGQIAIDYPVQFGDGQYKAKLYENTTDTAYKRVFFTTFKVEVEDTLTPFLNSHLEMNWNTDNAAILQAESLIQGLKKTRYEEENDLDDVSDTELYEDIELSEMDIITVIHEFVISHVQYDYDKIDDLEYNYLPNIDRTLEEGTGICYDYATLFGSMLRSQGIPTKLIKGYTKTTNDVYHAWNEVYLSDEERWIVVDTTFDAYYYGRKQTYEIEKESSLYEVHKYY